MQRTGITLKIRLLGSLYNILRRIFSINSMVVAMYLHDTERDLCIVPMNHGKDPLYVSSASSSIILTESSVIEFSKLTYELELEHSSAWYWA